MGETASAARFRSGGLTVGAPVPATSSRPCLQQTCHAKCSLRAPGSPALSSRTRPCSSTTSTTTASLRGFAACPKASQLLESERNQHRQGFIDIERLMTRLDELMPYDYSDNAVDEFGFLLAELKRASLERLSRARQGEVAKNDIAAFASHCAANNATCITFNYDDFLDEALWATGDWNPHWGYGFFCRSSLDAVSIYENAPGGSTLLLLKLHGSINWWPRLGYSQPFVLDAITHHHGWQGVDRHVYPQSLVARHLEAEPGHRSAGTLEVRVGCAARPPPCVGARVRELGDRRQGHLRRLFVPADRHGGSHAVLRSLAGPAGGRHRRRRLR